MAPIYFPESLEALGQAYDLACERLGAMGADFNRELLARQILRSDGTDAANIVSRVIVQTMLSYRVWETDTWNWQVLYKGHVVETGTANNSIEARAAAMNAGDDFRLN